MLRLRDTRRSASCMDSLWMGSSHFGWKPPLTYPNIPSPTQIWVFLVRERCPGVTTVTVTETEKEDTAPKGRWPSAMLFSH